MYYILFYKTVDNYVERRAQYRDEHLAYAKSVYESGSLVMGSKLVRSCKTYQERFKPI